MSSGQTPVRAQEEGPKLREEKHYRDFYPDLNHSVLLPVFTASGEETALQDIEYKARINALRQLSRASGSLKQIIYKNKVTVERLGPQLKKTCFKPCKVKVTQLNGKYHVPAVFHRYGYRSNVQTLNVDLARRAYMKKTDDLLRNENEFFVDVSRYLRDFKVQYDMDEQDDLYLQYLNSGKARGSANALSAELFEILITALEIEWFYLERKIPQRHPTNQQSSTHESEAAIAHYELYGSDDGSGSSADQSCAICNGTDSDNSNAIVFCDGCDVAVHQECYGVVFIPEGQWLCRRCMISKNRKINCLFCPSNTGAFKQTDTGSWGHVICGIWIPELFFANQHYMEPIEGIDMVPRSRWKLNCYICKQKCGACIQCSNKNCFVAYHVTCAKRAGLFMTFGGCTVPEAASKNFRPGVKLESFCDKHSPSGWGDCQVGILKTRRYFENIKEMVMRGNQRATSSEAQQPPTRNRWKTNRGTPIAPQLFATILKQLLDKFGIAEAEQTAIDICKYWSMKRELKRGAPLVRIFDPTSFNSMDSADILKRVAFADVLLNDLAKLDELSTLLVRRQQAAQARLDAVDIINDLGFHPVRHLVQKNVTTHWSTKEFIALMNFEPAFAGVLAKVDSDQYDSIASFSREVRTLFDQIAKEKDIPVELVSTITVCQRQFSKQIAKIEGLDVHKLMSRDFIFEGKKIREVDWHGPILMKEEELSEVEEDELTPAQERILKSFLRY
ncbi:ACR193Cp [Eremothecium gossypii ATCC 10895]|uniref:ACR193Cp n=1 Tax=Eremothecium gossypii (strain ATCC 10895 / CBS 109.51 / FGSC 9923 / NRRL Y-1056) TaxID=284811 RepID=Q75BS8_EREGS|nr:ACR193Cp [Eremothecium gossypii ATCC 10895]AAS51419.1 ACR193Cp [Eremothecium gossypii ATCC 10895]AEY95710.1 FACR193Cp [Eremothecium gossypii FDAG1]